MPRLPLRVLLLSVVFASALAAQEAQETPRRPPLKQQEVVQLLGAHVSPARLSFLVKRYGIDFDPESSLDTLRAAGADETLIDALKLSVVAVPTPAPSKVAARRGGPPSPSPRSAPAPSSTPSPHPFEPGLVLVRDGPKGDFYLARREVTNREYTSFCKQTRHRKPEAPFWATDPDFSQFPVVRVSWEDAVAYCQWLSRETGGGYRLPLEKEWELAARGGRDLRTYPWGEEEPDPKKHACFDRPQPCRVGSFGANPLGLHDLAGNVAEWVHDRVGNDAPVKGGSFNVPREKRWLLAISLKDPRRLDARKTYSDVGFRVARNP